MIEAAILFQSTVLSQNIQIFSTEEAVMWILLVRFQATCSTEKGVMWLDDEKYYGGDRMGC